MSDQGLRRLAASACALAILCGLATLTLLAIDLRHGLAPYPSASGDLAVGMLFPLAGLLVINRQPRNGAGWVLLSTALVAVSALGHQVAWHSANLPDLALPATGVAVWFASWAYVPYFLQPTLLPVLFPDGTPPSPRWRLFARTILVLVAAAAIAAAFRPDTDFEGLGLTKPLGIPNQAFAAATVVVTITTAVGCLFVAAPVSLVALVRRMRAAEGATRSQLQWLIAGFLTYLLLVVAGNLPGIPRAVDEVLFTLGFVAIPTAIAVAVVRHAFLDIEVVVNRAIVYAILTAGGVLAYVAGVAAVGRWFSARDIGPLAGAAAATAALLVRERVQELVDRWLFGHRSDPVTILDRVGATVASTHPEHALRALVDVLTDSLRLPWASVVTHDPPTEVATGHPRAELATWPVLVDGHEHGSLHVSHRFRGERFRPEEEIALADAARRAGAVLQAARLTSDLRRSREQIVATREEERRRLRHDLHDGVGPTLAGMALQLDGLARRLDTDADVDRRVTGLRDSLGGLIVEVRRIVDGLRPAAVAEHGLRQALTLLATDDGPPQVTVTVPDALPTLPAAVEVAAYRIATEAVANVLRHARADRCEVRLALADDALCLHVEDDGVGFDDARPGVGLVSMVERGEEVGGVVTVDGRAGRGTVVSARLPLGTP